MSYRALLTAVVLMASSHVHATAWSKSELSDFTITLIDLNPADSVAPSISFVHTGGTGSGSAINGLAAIVDANWQFVYVDSYFLQADSPTAFLPLEGAVSNGAAHAASSIVRGPTDLGPHHLTVEGGVDNPDEGHAAYYSAYATHPGLNSSGFYGFTLSPFTKAIFSTAASLSASTTIGYNPTEGLYETSYASFSLYAGEVVSDGPKISSSDILTLNAGSEAVEVPQYDEHGQLIGHETVYFPQNKSLSRLAFVDFYNLNSGYVDGELSVHMGASGGSTNAMVPEVDAGTMTLAGLVVLGAFLGKANKRAYPYRRR